MKYLCSGVGEGFETNRMGISKCEPEYQLGYSMLVGDSKAKYGAPLTSKGSRQIGKVACIQRARIAEEVSLALASEGCKGRQLGQRAVKLPTQTQYHSKSFFHSYMLTDHTRAGKDIPAESHAISVLNL